MVDGCEGSGQYIPFPKTKADRMASGDPRLSVEERYRSYADYRKKVIAAIDGLVRKRFVLCDDTDDMLATLVQSGQDAGVPAPGPYDAVSTEDQIPACQPHSRHRHNHHRFWFPF